MREARTVAEKRTLAWSEQWREKGRQEGQLDLLVDLIRQRFGDTVAETALAALHAMQDPNALSRVGGWLLDSESADAFLARLKSA